MDYKKIISNQETRFAILRLLTWVPDSIMLRIQYRIKMGFWPDFKHPKRFTEKLQLYKMRYRNPVMHQCVDKYEVRKYVESKGLGHILNELYGVYDKPEDINFSKLPNQFVMKTTTGGGGQNVIIVKDKESEDLDELRKMLSQWSGANNLGALAGREWAYSQCKPRIIVEQLLADAGQEGGGNLTDFKLLFFNGKFRLLWIDKDRYTNHRRGFWNERLEFMPNLSWWYESFKNPPVLPRNLSEMISFGEILSKDFPHARIDFYNVDGKIYFGEITFYANSGYGRIKPDDYDYKVGEWFTEYG